MADLWSVYYDILQSRNCYGANLEHLDGVAALMNQIVSRRGRSTCTRTRTRARAFRRPLPVCTGTR